MSGRPHEQERIERERSERKVADAARMRLNLAARFLTAALAAASHREDEVWTEEELSAQIRGSLRIADLLIEAARG